MIRKILVLAILVAIVLTVSAVALAQSEDSLGRPGSDIVIYVTGQGLYYDSIVTADPLPQQGPFQQLVPIIENGQLVGLETEFGPGDKGFVGGRWWVDVNGNGEMDAEDHFFSCPLLGPGRTTP